MYRDFYGFTRLPFQPTNDPACYFESLGQGQAQTCLRHGLARADGFVVLTGEVGTGKTTLVTQVLATIDRDRVTVAQLAGAQLAGDHLPTGRPADTQLSSSQIVPAIARAFDGAIDAIHGTPAGSRHPFTLDALLCFLREEVRAGRQCLLVVDDAQALPIATLDALRLMSDFQSGDNGLLQILLVGQPELRTRLQCHPQLEQLRRQIVSQHHLGPLAADEVESYIHHRLTCVGWNGNPGFGPQIPAAIYSATSGLPRAIDRIMDRLLRLGAAQQHPHIGSADLSRVLAEWPARNWGEGENHAVAGRGLKTRLEVALARSAAQIAELRQAVAQLAATRDRHAHAAPDYRDDVLLEERLSSLESRVFEQEGTIRHTLTMLIDWIERDEAHSVAA